MTRIGMILAVGVLALLPPSPARAQTPSDTDAKALAQSILDKGSALFDARDASGLAATYTLDATVTIYSKEQGSTLYSTQIKEGRGAIESLYRDTFNNQSARTTSKNTVEFARLVAPDLLIIQGYFNPDISKESRWPFVQVRTKQGEAWRMLSLQLFLTPQ